MHYSSLLHAHTSRLSRTLPYIFRPIAPFPPFHPPTHHRRFTFSPLRSTVMHQPKPQPVGPSKVLIFGAGNFGSCLASHLGDSLHEVYMWAREVNIVNHFNKYHRNPAYLKDHEFPKNITALGPDFPSKEIVEEMDVLLFAIPTQFLRSCASLLTSILSRLTKILGKICVYSAPKSKLITCHL